MSNFLVSFDDILYQGVEYVKKQKQMSAEFMHTDEAFLQSAYNIYVEIEAQHAKGNPTFFSHDSRTGFTTAIQFVTCYYAMVFPSIMIMTKKQAQYIAKLEKTLDLFNKFSDLGLTQDKKSNQIIIKKSGKLLCDISFHTLPVFDISNLHGCVIFDDCSKMTNPEKYSDLLINVDRCDRLVFNFPKSDIVNKLAQDNNLGIKEVKIL